jgi:hypothetical protein
VEKPDYILYGAFFGNSDLWLRPGSLPGAYRWWYRSLVTTRKHIARCLLLLAATAFLSGGSAFGQNAPTDYRMWQRGYDRSTVYRSMNQRLTAPRVVPAPRVVVPDSPLGQPRLEGPSRAYRGSLPNFSPEWLDYCRAKYNSFNPRTGKYLSYGGVYRTCR